MGNIFIGGGRVRQTKTQKDGITTYRTYDFAEYSDAIVVRNRLFNYGYDTEIDFDGAKWIVEGSIPLDTLENEEPIAEVEEPTIKFELDVIGYNKDLLSSDTYNVQRMVLKNKTILKAAAKNPQKFSSGSVVAYPSFVGTIEQRDLAMECYNNIVAGVTQVPQNQPVIRSNYICSQEWYNENFARLKELDGAIMSGEQIISFFEGDAPSWIESVLRTYRCGDWAEVNGLSTYPDSRPYSNLGWKVSFPKTGEAENNKLQISQEFVYGDYSVFVHSTVNI